MKFRVGLNFEQRVGVGRNTVTGCPQWPTAPLFSAYLLQSLHSAGKRNELACVEAIKTKFQSGPANIALAASIILLAADSTLNVDSARS